MPNYRTVHLSSHDFVHGSYIITQSGRYVLDEDIIFHPNPDDDFFPRPDQEKYAHPAFSLGFFAAIVIAAPHVTLDLNGHSITQSPEFALQQRFYAHIEITNTPFINGQGPGFFGPFTGSADYGVIKNGTLGLSSHHGIHGNKVKYLTIKNLIIKDFEVAAIAVNGFKHLNIYDIEAGPSRTDVPVNARYSHGRFLHLLCRPWLAKNKSELPQQLVSDFEQALTVLEQEMDVVLNLISQGQDLPSDNYFALQEINGMKITDGGNYGMLFTVPGVAVNDYVRNAPFISKDLKLKNVNIHGIRCVPLEVVALGPGQNDVAGAVFRILDVLSDKDELGGPKPDATYVGDLLSNVQLLAAEAGHIFGTPIAKSNITPDVVAWSKNGTPYSSLSEESRKLQCNGDSMFHVLKGGHGIRLDGMCGVELDNVSIDTVENYGRMGSLICGPYDKSHRLQTRLGYSSAQTTGISCADISQVQANNVQIKNLHAANGPCRGIRVMNQCQNITMDKLKIDNVIVANKGTQGENSLGQTVPFTAERPNGIPWAMGICVEQYQDEMSKDCHFPSSKISNVYGPADCNVNYAEQTLHG